MHMCCRLLRGFKISAVATAPKVLSFPAVVYSAYL